MADKLRDKENLGVIAVSGLTGEGVPQLVEAIAVRLKERASGVGVAVRERHRRAIMLALQGLQVALGLLEDDASPIEVVAEIVRAAIQALNALVGRVDVEDILGEIFARFCIGK